MDPTKDTVKTRIIAGIGLNVVNRPRELQLAAGTAEHHVVHALYMLEKQGLVTYKVKQGIHAPGRNLTAIKLTERGVQVWRQLNK